MKKVLYTITLISLTLISYSQDFSGGLLFGISGNQIDGDRQSGYKKPGLVLGAFVGKPLSDRGSFRIETYYIGKGAVLTTKYPDGTSYQEFKTDLHYIEMPLLYNYKLHPKFDISIGIALSYLFSERRIELMRVIDKSAYNMRGYDLQPIGQVDFYLTDKLSTSVRFSYSVLNINIGDVSWFNKNLSIVLRYKFK